MSPLPINDLSRFCIHTITTKPWNLEDATAHYAAAGVKGVTVWRQWLEGRDVAASGRRIRESGLEVVSLCRGGFFPATAPPKRQAAIDDNRRAIDEAEALGAPLIVLVCGAALGQSLEVSRAQITDGIAAVLDHARQANVKLGIEPLHPMYADIRSAVNTLRQANEMAEKIADPLVGVVVDVYHLWWDPDLKAGIERAGRAGKIFAFHVSDWRTPTEDLLNDRALMGEGCIPIPEIRGWVEANGFTGYVEVEIFSNRWWAADQADFLNRIKTAYLHHV